MSRPAEDGEVKPEPVPRRRADDLDEEKVQRLKLWMLALALLALLICTVWA
jgi:hypothetical protein